MTESGAAVGGKRVCVLHHFYIVRTNACARVITDITFPVLVYCAGTDYDAPPTPDVLRLSSGSIVDRASCARPRGPAAPGFAACLVLAGAIGLSVATENCTSVRFRSRGSVVLDAPVHGFQFRARRSASGALTGPSVAVAP